MRWSCPHCGVSLALGDDKFGGGWSFSRCFKCAGFALVRKAEVNIIKVDKAPPGERVLLPEANEEPLLGHTALQNQREIEGRRATAALEPPPQVQATPPAPPRRPTSMHAMDLTGLGLPEPLPEVPQANGSLSSWVRKVLPLSIGIAAFGTLSSGGYLLIRGQELFSKARTQPAVMPPIAAAPQAEAPAPAGAINDQVVHQAMAPERAAPPAPQAQAEVPNLLRVKMTAKTARIHQGPGLAFAAIAQAAEGQVFVVTGWQDRWFRVQLADGVSFGWIKNESVSLITGAN